MDSLEKHTHLQIVQVVGEPEGARIQHILTDGQEPVLLTLIQLLQNMAFEIQAARTILLEPTESAPRGNKF